MLQIGSVNITGGVTLAGQEAPPPPDPNIGVTWTYQSGLESTLFSNQSGDARSIIYDDSQYVVIGNMGGLATSPDAVIWTYTAALKNSGFTGPALRLAFSGSVYVVCGGNGAAPSFVSSSSNLVNWTSGATSLINSGWDNAYNPRMVIWNGSIFLMVGDAGQVATSTNGTTWTYHSQLSTTGWGTGDVYGAVWTGTKFLIGGQGGKIASSTDGITWTYHNGLSTTGWGEGAYVFTLEWNGSIFCAGGQGARLATSSDGITWTYLTGALSDWSGAAVNAVEWLGDKFVAGGGSGRIATSTDGITWTNQTALRSTSWGTSNSVNGFALNNGLLVACGNGPGSIATSPA